MGKIEQYLLQCKPDISRLVKYLPITHSWFAAELSVSGQDGGCKQRGQTATIWSKHVVYAQIRDL